MSDPQAALAWCPFPDHDSARTAAGALLDENLIACANIMPQVESIFQYEGRIASEREVAVLFKTSAAMLDALIGRLGELHPYDTPAILAWRCDAAHPATLEWLTETLR